MVFFIFGHFGGISAFLGLVAFCIIFLEKLAYLHIFVYILALWANLNGEMSKMIHKKWLKI